jgi:hypothetical protein
MTARPQRVLVEEKPGTARVPVVALSTEIPHQQTRKSPPPMQKRWSRKSCSAAELLRHVGSTLISRRAISPRC